MALLSSFSTLFPSDSLSLERRHCCLSKPPAPNPFPFTSSFKWSVTSPMTISHTAQFHASPLCNLKKSDSMPNISLHLPSPVASAPQTPATAARGAAADAMGLLLKERIVFLGSEVDEFVADAIISQLLLLDAQDPSKDIRLFINCGGGSFNAVMAIYDVIRLVRADVSTVALGTSASTASIILGGGTKGKRLAMPNTRIMIHQPLGRASGKAKQVEIQAEETMQQKETVVRIISEVTGRSREQVEKDINRDLFMSPIEAVEYGIIDGVIDRDSIIPVLPVPEKVKATLNFTDFANNPKMMLPDIPDDEIY